VQGQVVQSGVFGDSDPVFAAGPAPVPQFEVLQLAGAGVGGERGQPVAIDVVEAELGSGVGPFPAHDHAHVFGPAVEVEQSGELCHVSAFTGVVVAVEGRGPHPFGDLLVEAGGVQWEGEPDGVGDPVPREPLGEVFGAAGPVSTDQDLLARSRVRLGQLRQRGLGDGDVVGGGVGAGVAWTQMSHQRLTSPGWAVVAEGEQGMEPEASLERRCRVLLVRMCGDQAGIQINHQRGLNTRLVVRGVHPGQVPHPCSGLLPCRGDGVQGLVSILSQHSDQSGHGRIGSHASVDAGLGTQHGDIAEGFPTQDQTDHQIADDLSRIMHRQGFTPPTQSLGQAPVQPRHEDRFGQQHPASLTDRGHLRRVNMDLRIQAGSLHLEGAPRLESDVSVVSHIIPSQGHFRYLNPPPQPTPHESARLDNFIVVSFLWGKCPRVCAARELHRSRCSNDA